MTEINDQTPIVMLTVGQLKEMLREEFHKQETIQKDYTTPKYIFGLKGIREEFNVSHSTAQKYKNTILKDAVIQHGRKIIIDVEKARLFFAGKNASK